MKTCRYCFAPYNPAYRRHSKPMAAILNLLASKSDDELREIYAGLLRLNCRDILKVCRDTLNYDRTQCSGLLAEMKVSIEERVAETKP